MRLQTKQLISTMRIKEAIIATAMTTLLCTTAEAKHFNISFAAGRGGFDLTQAKVVYDAADAPMIATVAEMFASDISMVSGKESSATYIMPKKGTVVMAGTIEGNQLIAKLAKSGNIDVKEITGEPERYVIARVKNPVKGIDEALVVAGSDRRGAAYGLMEISRRMGVSPWWWWADVPVERHDNVYVDADYVSEAPSVKYRGIFINDEDWGLKTWASNNFEKELNDIGPETYAKVCELLLRLKGNMLAPAMHSCTGAFYSHPESKVMADRYGIIITTSHCEPLLFNNAAKSEWDKSVDGEWNYMSNRDRIYGKLDARVKEAAPYENIYTLAMRGLHDEGMRGDLTNEEKVVNLTNAIRDQREILNRHLSKPVAEVPQIFVPYKEALEVYEDGLQVPDDVTLIWVDDNYGYIKRLSNPEEQKRSGQSGVYYHTSYLGAPHDYLWLNTTPPVLMYEELKKAYDTGADRYWLLNIGDIKPMELGMDLFFDMAWNFSRYNYDNVNEAQAQFLSGIYGKVYQKEMQDILDSYYRLAWSRKPEFMGWEREWDSKDLEKIQDTEYSYANHNDAQNRLEDYRRISDAAAAIMKSLPEKERASFFEMLGYPVMASCQMNRKFMMAQLNHELARDAEATDDATLAVKLRRQANWAAEESQAAFDSINSLNALYNGQLDGKWNEMMHLAPGWCAKYQLMPELSVKAGIAPEPADIMPRRREKSGFAVLDLSAAKTYNDDKTRMRTLRGIGYDWVSLQLGEATGIPHDPTDPKAPRADYRLGKVDNDSVTMTVYALPFFPLYKGKGTKFGISVDGGEVNVLENRPKEHSSKWKTDVLRNGTCFSVTLPIDSSLDHHTVSLTCGDPGVIIERVIVDWGGLGNTYVGPDLDENRLCSDK